MRQKLFFLAFLLLGSALFAQNNNTLLNKLVEKEVLTEEEVDEILAERSKETSQLNLDNIKRLLSTPYLQLGGYGLFTYQYNSQENIKHDVSPRLVVLSIRGTVAKNVNYLVLMDFSTPWLLEFNAEWKPFNAFALKAGQFKVPFTLENQYSPTALETINNTRSLGALAGMVGDPLQFTESKRRNKGGRDLGIQISGEVLNLGSHSLISYAGGLFQGQGINQKEANNKKDFVGSLYFQPIKNFFIGGSSYFGQVTKYGEDISHVRNRWAVSTKYSCKHFDARAEYLRGNDGGTDKEGCYGTGVYKMFNNKLQMVGKVDYYSEKNKDIKNGDVSKVMDYTAGVNYNFYKTCRLQVNYTYSDYNNIWDAKDCSSVQAQMQIVF